MPEPKKAAPLANTKSVAATMGVHQRTLTEAARKGQYKVRRTPGGHYRFEVDPDGWPIEAEEKKR